LEWFGGDLSYGGKLLNKGKAGEASQLEQVETPALTAKKSYIYT
jgi:hypothetical protein